MAPCAATRGAAKSANRQDLEAELAALKAKNDALRTSASADAKPVSPHVAFAPLPKAAPAESPAPERTTRSSKTPRGAMLMVHNVASEMHCPLTKELFVDPVLTTAGNTYERKAIVAWFTDHETDPVSGEALESKALIPNNTMKKAVEQVRASKAAAVSGSTSSSIDFERSNSCGASSIASSAMTAATTAAKEELEDMRKKLATFMLGGDMSGGQAGTHAALTLSNAITNLSVGCWGQVAVLEPLPTANLAKWRQQIKWSATPRPAPPPPLPPPSHHPPPPCRPRRPHRGQPPPPTHTHTPTLARLPAPAGTWRPPSRSS